MTKYHKSAQQCLQKYLAINALKWLNSIDILKLYTRWKSDDLWEKRIFELSINYIKFSEFFAGLIFIPNNVGTRWVELLMPTLYVFTISFNQVQHLILGGFSIGVRGVEPPFHLCPKIYYYHFWVLIIDLKTPFISF